VKDIIIEIYQFNIQFNINITLILYYN